MPILKASKSQLEKTRKEGKGINTLGRNSSVP